TIQERQERLFLYLNIILGASIVIEAINILIDPFRETFEYLVIRYAMSFTIIAIFGIILLSIFRRKGRGDERKSLSSPLPED
ncbi:MAG: hypothetical protein ACFFE7_10650, partial [Candidatus Thorarchaeota archaeon]